MNLKVTLGHNRWHESTKIVFKFWKFYISYLQLQERRGIIKDVPYNLISTSRPFLLRRDGKLYRHLAVARRWGQAGQSTTWLVWCCLRCPSPACSWLQTGMRRGGGNISAARRVKTNRNTLSSSYTDKMHWQETRLVYKWTQKISVTETLFKSWKKWRNTKTLQSSGPVCVAARASLRRLYWW